MSIVLTEYGDQGLVTDATQAGAGVAGVLNGAKLILAKASFAPSATLAVGGISQPTYTGYAPAAMTWTAAHRDVNNDIVTESAVVPIQMGDSLTPTTIFGYGVTDSGGTHLIMSELFATPLPLVDALTYFGLTVPFAPAQPQVKSAIVTS